MGLDKVTLDVCGMSRLEVFVQLASGAMSDWYFYCSNDIPWKVIAIDERCVLGMAW